MISIAFSPKLARRAGRAWAAFVAWLVLGTATHLRAAEIPERPEKLTFPPLTYEPPDPTAFRVELRVFAGTGQEDLADSTAAIGGSVAGSGSGPRS